jgi:hypothetical protein
MENKKSKDNQLIEPNIGSNNDISRSRQSFSDRICDDLCELIVSYLSFEDKIRFECVSKQFQRLVYNKQNVLLIMNSSYDRNNLFKLMKKRDNYSNDKQLLINKIAFETVLKKCKFINQIIINCDFNNREVALKLINKNCSHLKSIAFNFYGISEQFLKEFGLKFGQQLRSIDFVIRHYNKINNTEFDSSFKRLFRLCPNLLSLMGVKLSYLIDSNQVLVPKLSKLKLYYEETDRQLVDSFARNYRNTLKSLHILNGFIWDENNLYSLLKRINCFEKLEDLKLTAIRVKEFSSVMIDIMTNIGIKCKNLKSLYISAQIESLIASNLFESMTHFVNLKLLKLDTFGSNFSYKEGEEVSIKSLMGCKRLTNISLMYLNLNDNFFNNIDQYLPQLTHLNISFNDEITNNTMNSLAKLNKLEVVIIKASKKHFLSKERIDEGMCNLITSCPQIKSIQFFSRPNITHKTIEALIALAIKRPRINFHHLFADIDMRSKYNPYFTVIEIQDYQNLPNNLRIFTSF